MNKLDLIRVLAEKAAVTQQQAEAVLNGLIGTIHESIKTGDELLIHGIGKFVTADRAARIGRNPSTGEAIQIAARRVPVFTAAKALKDVANRATYRHL